MLYDCFRVAVMVAAVLGIIHMFAMESFIYIYFPVASLIWGFFSFFDESDKEYIRRNCYDDYNTNYYNNRVYAPSSSYRDSSYFAPARRNQYTMHRSKGKEYEGIVKKCKRNFKITIAEDGEL